MSEPLTPEEFIAVTRREAAQRFGHRAGEILAQVPEAGAPRSAIARLMEQWEHEVAPEPSPHFGLADLSPSKARRDHWREGYAQSARDKIAALRACADPPEAPHEEQDLRAILQSVLTMIGLSGFNAAWFDEHGDWDFGKLRANGLDAKLAEIRAALRACAKAPATDSSQLTKQEFLDMIDAMDALPAAKYGSWAEKVRSWRKTLAPSTDTDGKQE